MKAYCKDCDDYTVVFVLTPDSVHLGKHECTECKAIKGWLSSESFEKPVSTIDQIGA